MSEEMTFEQKAHLAAVNDLWAPNGDAAVYHAVAEKLPYAAKIKGFDPSGRVRVLALDWDGRWHDLSPGQVQPQPRTQRADQFNVGDKAIHDGRVWIRVKSDLSIEQIVFAAEDDSHVGLIAAADAEMEVAP